ncbi:hypothetical protein DBV14_02150 [Variovorax sp. KBW07]|uniref:hypothetical protein n=1 Tax=Variovorax sp. KBW07 TaxID=2153358 RepID=UPI000F58CA07|nr:hypothetical protein [Variovorax sp. KBW07]RQO63856.1 hypothetical protein DBV14_02150 [Variovorax sp. KBW07]
MAEVLRACHRVAIDAKSIEIIDEEQAAVARDLAGVVLKICEQLSPETIRRLLEEIQTGCPKGVSAWLIKGASPADFALDSEDISTEYFRHEFAVDSNMIHHAESCARLTHHATGWSARSTAHRSRALNFEEALFLLESLVRSGSEDA